MALHASWVHGNALMVETPGVLSRDGHFGWGRDLRFIPDKGSWLHVPLPTPVIAKDTRTKVQKFYLTFLAENCEIRAVHLFDGSSKVQELSGLHLRGEHRTGLDSSNTFNLAAPHTVAWGMGITFSVQADIGFDSAMQTRFILASAGGDFFTP